MPILVFIGKEESIPGASRTSAIVLKLVEGLHHKGHHLYCDNYYTSPALFLALRNLGFGACGTVNSNRRGIPACIKAKDKMKKGEVKVESTDGVLALKWMDKRPVCMLSTIHGDEMVTKRRRTRLAEGGVEDINKPLVVAEYNTYMGGVDKADQLLSYYPFSHRTVKWWKRAFFHLLDVALVNSYIMYTESTQIGRKLTHEQFRVEVAKGLLLQVGISEGGLEGSEIDLPHCVVTTIPEPLRLTGRHFPERLAPCSSGRPRQCVCVVCSNKKGRRKVTSIYQCKICKLCMCITPCFELYHTKVDPTRHLPQLPP